MTIPWENIKKWTYLILFLPILVYIARSWDVPNKVDNLHIKVAHIEGFLAAKSGEQFSSTSDDDYEKSQDKDVCKEDEDNPVVFAFLEE